MAHIDLRNHDTVLVATLSGELTLDNLAQIRSELEVVLNRQGVEDIVFDLAGITFLDSSGLGVLVSASTRARASGRRILLYRPSREVTRLLEAAQLTGLFPLLADEEDLLALLPD